MQNKQLIRFAQALLLLPMMSLQGLAGNIPNQTTDVVKASPIVLSQKQNIGILNFFAQNSAVDKDEELRQIKADAIDSYFEMRDMPLGGLGMKMVLEAEKNDIDWRLLPAISVRESTGGKNDCKKVKHNAFGWGSCKIGFKSDDEAIETVARNLGGNNPKTSHYYDNKTTMQILRIYNPPSVVKRYAEQVIKIMDTIGAEEIIIPDNQINT